MSSNGVFIIEEFRRIGATTITDAAADSSLEVFNWINDFPPIDAVKGGARATPEGPMEIAGKQRTVRTDYPGTRNPSEQVLGPSFEPVTFHGMFQDKYNFAGYAAKEMKRLEDMFRRGNPVRISYQGQVFEGIITAWKFPYRGDFEIKYEFTFSNHGRPGENTATRTGDTGAAAHVSFDDADVIAQALIDFHQQFKPTRTDKSDYAKTTEVNLSTIAAGMNSLASSIDTRKGALRPIQEFKKLATQFRIVAGSAQNVCDSLVAVRSDIDLSLLTAKSVLDFEGYSRTTRTYARLLSWKTSRAAKDMDAHAQPKALRIYEPFRGESLYSVSRKVYGTPFAWRLIADRNGLRTMNLTGNERLIIPERGAG